MTLDQIKALSLGTVGDAIAANEARRETLPNLETPFLVYQGPAPLLPSEPCTFDCTECSTAGRCLIDYPDDPFAERYVHTDADVPEFVDE